ncbi:MAG: hypothetical protein RI985_308 [Chloroflexota bacterium]|jgi:hypothetical protein
MKIVMRILVTIMIGLLLVACADSSTSVLVLDENATSGGGPTPEVTVENFLSDLNKALKDPNLNRADVRAEWSDILSNYFAPVERTSQRVAIRTSLDKLVTGVAQLNSDETVSFDIQFEPARRVRERDEVVYIEVPNAVISMLISRNSNRGNVTVWKQNESLGYMIGSNENVFPVLQVGNRWFLTEN